MIVHQWLSAVVAAVMVSACSSTEVLPGCEGEIKEHTSFALRFVECWARDADGELRRNGPTAVYRNDKLYLRGQALDGESVGVWHAFDDEGNVVDTCNFSTEPDCVLTEE